ncbi:cytochrome b-c1 complex subunit 2, mitochondrial-like [Watersipora subatra]|uniref:cytochrome b-c1 complex subunit 2, mitochondrial-like n=1 Tax=Watersipora subatra TaxID=2589382 RepID=UPI00355C5FA5
MAQRVISRVLQKRFYGAAPAVAKGPAKPVLAAEVLVDKTSNGVSVATQDSHSSLARVVLAVKAGSRYEEPHQRGAAHCLRVISDLTQKEVRTFRLTRELSQMAANISVTTSREHIFYTLEVPKDNVGSALPFLTGMAFSPSFRPWEISDTMPKMEYELLCLTEQPEKRVVENAHDVAFRSCGLGRSIYSPVFQMSEFSPDMLMEYVGKNFTADRVSFSGMGVDRGALLDLVGGLKLQSSSLKNPPAQYFGGESRESSEQLSAFTVLAGEGASSTGEDMWAFAALEQLLGSGPQIKWSSNTTSNRLNAAISQKTQEPFSVQSFNVNYSDSGLFGITAVTVPESSELVIKTAADQLKELASKSVDAASLQAAKNRVKATVAFQNECPSDAMVSRAVELLNTGKLADTTSTMAAIDSVTASAVQNAAKKVLSSRISMASIGEIHNVPYVDQL